MTLFFYQKEIIRLDNMHRAFR